MGFLLKIEGDFENFYVDFFCKIEGDLNFLVNFFLAGFIFKGVYYMILMMISIFWWIFLSKRKDITDPSHHYWIFKKYVNLCAMGENHQYNGRSFTFLVLNSILDVKKKSLNLPELL